MTKLTREQIRQRLLKLAEEPAPECLPIQATCYSPVRPPNEAVYICPKCLHRTTYSYSHENYDYMEATNILDMQLCHLRGIARSIGCMWIELDESEYCRNCSPNITQPRLNLIIRADDEPNARIIKGITEKDIDLLECFSKDFKTINIGYGATAPLKDNIERLETLLGVNRGA